MSPLPKFPELPDPENIFSIIDKAGNAFDRGLSIIDKVAEKFDRAADKIGPPEEIRPRDTSIIKTPRENKPPSGASDNTTLLYQLEHILAPLRQLEIHLSEGCRLLGTPCDCCAKSAYDIRNFSQETIPIAARMGRETSIFSELVTWASNIEAIGDPDKVESGEYNETYRQESGPASIYRKKVQSLISEIKKEDECPGCEELRESISAFIEKRKMGRS